MTRAYDLLPEETRYRDDGCEVAPHCLECPLEVCRFDLEPVRHFHNTERDIEILERRRAGMAVKVIARTYGLSTRSVFRVLSRSK